MPSVGLAGGASVCKKAIGRSMQQANPRILIWSEPYTLT